MPVADAFPPDLPVLATIRGEPGAREWAAALPALVADLERSWKLTTEAPFRTGVAAWTAPATRRDGTAAVLKVGWPHPEGRDEAAALAHWGGRGAVHLLESDPARAALLVERCHPGTPLSAAPDGVDAALDAGAAVLRALHTAPAPTTGRFTTLTARLAGAADRARERAERLRARPGPDVDGEVDPGVLRIGIELLATLRTEPDVAVLLHGDANPGNLLRAERAPWLAIDPKPAIGDPAFDPAPLLLQVHADAVTPTALRSGARRLADALSLDPERILTWAVAREVEGLLWARAGGRRHRFSPARAAAAARALSPSG